MKKITVMCNGISMSYVPTPGTDLSKLDIVPENEVEAKTKAKIGNRTIEYISRPVNKEFKPIPRFKGGDDIPINPKERDPNDVTITSEEPSEGLHTYNEGFWVNDDGEVMADDEFYRFNAEYVQMCKRKFDCYVPNYTNTTGLEATTLMVDVSGSKGLFDTSYGEVKDNSTAMELTRLSVIDIANYMYDGVPVTTHSRDTAFHIITIINDALDKYIGAIPVAPTTFVVPEQWFEPLVYLRETILDARPGLIAKLATNLDHTGKPRRPRLKKL